MFFKISVNRLLQAAIEICGIAQKAATAQVQKQSLAEARLIRKQNAVSERRRKAAAELCAAGELKQRLKGFMNELEGAPVESDK